jgi:hypothetical protein
MHTGCWYSTPIARIEFRLSIRPVCCIINTARRPQNARPVQIEMPSSSLHKRINRRAGSREIGHSSPSLVTMSGTAATNSTRAAFSAAMMSAPCGPG